MALLLRGARLGHQSLWVDEVFSWRSARIGAAFTRHDLLENIHGPLYGVLLHAWGAIAGDGELALRLPSALFGAALVPALAWVARQWLGRDTVVPAAWLAAGSPFLLWYSQEARNYALLMLCATLASGAMLSLREKSSWRGLAGYAAASVAGVLSNFSFVLLAPIHAAWWLGARGERGKRLAVHFPNNLWWRQC